MASKEAAASADNTRILLSGRQRKVREGSPELAGSQNTSGTLARGLSIVQILIKSSQPLMLADIAALANLDQSTAYRILQTLESEGYVLKLRGERRYLPSPKSMKPLAPAHPLEQFRRDAGPVLAELAADFRMTIVLVVYLAGQRLVVDVAQHAGSLMPYYESSLNGPLHGSAPGKALLLATPPANRRDLLGSEPYESWTPHTKTSWAQLEPDLADATRVGYVWQRDEYYEGITAVGANFENWAGRAIGCIAVTGRTRELPPARVTEIGENIVNAALLVRMQASSLHAMEQICGL